MRAQFVLGARENRPNEVGDGWEASVFGADQKQPGPPTICTVVLLISGFLFLCVFIEFFSFIEVYLTKVVCI